ncbi:hypothetical protein M8J77_007225 [Diaphorina citri]|nr:hypothetical protein M8J77_007225 [Diaphorina citri]
MKTKKSKKKKKKTKNKKEETIRSRLPSPLPNLLTKNLGRFEMKSQNTNHKLERNFQLELQISGRNSFDLHGRHVMKNGFRFGDIGISFYKSRGEEGEERKGGGEELGEVLIVENRKEQQEEE